MKEQLTCACGWQEFQLVGDEHGTRQPGEDLKVKCCRCGAVLVVSAEEVDWKGCDR